MTDDINTYETPETTVETPASDSSESAVSTPKGTPWWSVASVVLTIVAWLALIFVRASGGYIAMGVAAVAAVLGFFGACPRNRHWRNLAITSVLASLVLLVVVGAFILVLTVGLS